VTWTAGVAVVCAVVLTLGTLTWRQARLYWDEESLWTHTITLNDRSWVAYYNRGIAHGTNYDWAIRDCTKAIELKPDDAMSYYNRGSVYDRKGDYEQAIRDYTQAIKLKPDYADAYYNRGNAYLNNIRDFNQAIRDYTKAIEWKPDFAVGAYNNRATAHFYLKHYDQAWADVQACRRAGGQPSLALLNWLKQATGRTD
jgi:tetratricopeptide (TPR) repeat protein